jgi:hypothetical protein
VAVLINILDQLMEGMDNISALFVAQTLRSDPFIFFIL